MSQSVTLLDPARLARWAPLVALGILAGTLGGCATAAPVASRKPTPEPSATDEVEAEPTTALEALALLEVHPRDPKTGYDRDAFGYRDVDFDRNGCDARNDVLGRDLVDVEFKPSTRDCVVESGVLFDPSRVTRSSSSGGTAPTSCRSTTWWR